MKNFRFLYNKKIYLILITVMICFVTVFILVDLIENVQKFIKKLSSKDILKYYLSHRFHFECCFNINVNSTIFTFGDL